jgi:hypothetical protein
MRHPPGFVLPAVVIALATLVTSCSSGQDKTPQGSLLVTLGASRASAQADRAGNEVADDAAARLNGANATIADVEARKTDGTWVPIESGLPVIVDLLALANGGATVTLPADFLPEGPYNALQLRITRVEPTLQDHTKVTIVPPTIGWVVLLPVDFSVVASQATSVKLNVRLDLSFKLANGEFEFEPEIEVAGVEHD